MEKREFEQVYLDNAATTLRKPDCVIEAVVRAMTSMGNAGRDAGARSMDASRIVFETRERLAALFGCADLRRVIFTKNSTEALNTAIRGMFSPGDHVISTVMEHNSVLRPVYAIAGSGAAAGSADASAAQGTCCGVSHTFVGTDALGRLCYDEIEAAIRPNTRALIVTHASNLTGNANDLSRIGAIAKRHGLYLIVDASQSAGVLPIDMQRMQIDVLCFTGHKGLYGPQGTGGLCVADGVEIRPLTAGGTGIASFLKEQPEAYPEHLEAGTLNAHGIAGLHAALGWIAEVTPEAIHRREIALMRRFMDGLKGLDVVKFYGDYENDARAAIAALNIGGFDSARVSDELSAVYGISTRPGAHCAPLMHEALGTKEQGIVRFSFSYFNTEAEADYAAACVRELAS